MRIWQCGRDAIFPGNSQSQFDDMSRRQYGGGTRGPQSRGPPTPVQLLEVVEEPLSLAA